MITNKVHFICPSTKIKHSIEVKLSGIFGYITKANTRIVYIKPFSYYAIYIINEEIDQVKLIGDGSNYVYSLNGLVRMARRHIFDHRKRLLDSWVACKCGNVLSDDIDAGIHIGNMSKSDLKFYRYYCKYCGEYTNFTFDISPVAIEVDNSGLPI